MAEWLTLAEAIAAHVHDGNDIAIEGLTHLNPFAAGHEKLKARTAEAHGTQENKA